MVWLGALESREPEDEGRAGAAVIGEAFVFLTCESFQSAYAVWRYEVRLPLLVEGRWSKRDCLGVADGVEAEFLRE